MRPRPRRFRRRRSVRRNRPRPHRRLGFGVETRKRDRLARRQIRRDAADRADLALDIVEPDVAFRGGIEFEHAERPESIEEARQTSAASPLPIARRSLWAFSSGRGGRGDEIAAEFADILKRRAIPARDIVPKSARRETLGDRDRAADTSGAPIATTPPTL